MTSVDYASGSRPGPLFQQDGATVVEANTDDAATGAELRIVEGVGPLYLEYQSGDYERSFTLSEAIDANGIEARVRNGVLHLKLPKAGPAKAQRIEVRAD